HLEQSVHRTIKSKSLGYYLIVVALEHEVESKEHIECLAINVAEIKMVRNDVEDTLMLYIGEFELGRIDEAAANPFSFESYPAVRALFTIFFKRVFPIFPTFEIGHRRDRFLQTIEKMKNRFTAIREFHPTVQVGVQSEIVA